MQRNVVEGSLKKIFLVAGVLFFLGCIAEVDDDDPYGVRRGSIASSSSQVNDLPEGCFESWINDGECDAVCGNFDALDCGISLPEGCYASWINDGACDAVCGNFDALDCGITSSSSEVVRSSSSSFQNIVCDLTVDVTTNFNRKNYGYEISAEASGDYSSLTYSLNGKFSKSVGYWDEVIPGKDVTISARDANGCEASRTIFLTQPIWAAGDGVNPIVEGDWIVADTEGVTNLECFGTSMLPGDDFSNCIASSGEIIFDVSIVLDEWAEVRINLNERFNAQNFEGIYVEYSAEKYFWLDLGTENDLYTIDIGGEPGRASLWVPFSFFESFNGTDALGWMNGITTIGFSSQNDGEYTIYSIEFY